MEEHMPEPRPSRTRDSSFSVDEEDPYFYPLPEDEEDFISKEFSSVYEDAQSERLAGMTKDELVQEYLLLQARCEALTKRLVAKPDPESVGESSLRLREQEEIIRQLRTDNQNLKMQLERPERMPSSSSNADSESDSSSTSCTGSTLSPPRDEMDVLPDPLVNGTAINGNGSVGEHLYGND